MLKAILPVFLRLIYKIQKHRKKNKKNNNKQKANKQSIIVKLG